MADVAGSATVAVNTTMLDHLQMYADKVRPCTPDSIKPACHFIVTSTVKPVEGGSRSGQALVSCHWGQEDCDTHRNQKVNQLIKNGRKDKKTRLVGAENDHLFQTDVAATDKTLYITIL